MASDVKDATTKGRDHHLEIFLRLVPSTIQVDGGTELPFQKAVLSLRNTGQTTVVGVIPHATLAQEGALEHDGTEPLVRAMTEATIRPGDEIVWDVYDLVLATIEGVASKVHLFGYRGILNWWYEMAIWVDYRLQDGAITEQTPVSRWRIHWSPADPPRDEIDLIVEVMAG